FQAEDGIRDRNVTGVQTCALPILSLDLPARTDQAVQATCAVPGSDIFPWHMPSALTVPKRHLPAHQKKGPPFGHVHGRLCSQFRHSIIPLPAYVKEKSGELNDIIFIAAQNSACMAWHGASVSHHLFPRV